MENKIRILGISGSLRKHSCNTGILRAAVEMAPDNCLVEIFDIKEIPLYNGDEEEANFPKSVIDFKEKIRKADAILFATPEYNYSISGVLKNAIDWASRPYGDSAWNDKPVAITGAALSIPGTARAQYHLRQMFVTLNMHCFNRPELMIQISNEKFDAEGNVIDVNTRKKIQELLEALVSFTKSCNEQR